jgi:hypothetical protein
MLLKNRKMITKASFRGAIASLVVSFIYTLFHAVVFFKNQRTLEIDGLAIGGLSLMFIVGVVITLPVAICGSAWLIFYLDKNRLGKKKAFMTGAFGGLLGALGVWGLLVFSYFYKGEIGVFVFLQIAFSAIVSGLCAGLVALQLQRDLTSIEPY